MDAEQGEQAEAGAAMDCQRINPSPPSVRPHSDPAVPIDDERSRSRLRSRSARDQGTDGVSRRATFDAGLRIGHDR